MNNYKTYNWIVSYLIACVTCAIYGIVVILGVNSTNNKIAETYGIEKRMNYLVAMLLGVVTCGIVPLVWMYRFNKQQVQLAQAVGATVVITDNAFLRLILSGIPFLGWYMMVTTYNNTVEAVNAQ